MQNKNNNRKNKQKETERKPLPSANILERRKEIFDLSRTKNAGSQIISKH